MRLRFEARSRAPYQFGWDGLELVASCFKEGIHALLSLKFRPARRANAQMSFEGGGCELIQPPADVGIELIAFGAHHVPQPLVWCERASLSRIRPRARERLVLTA